MNSLELARLLGRHRPTPQQVAIIEAPHEPSVVIAGAGSGKTTTMADRVLWLVANGIVPAESILGLTFTRKAAIELAARIRIGLRQLRTHGLAPTLAGEPTISTYHSYGARILAEHALRDGVEPPSRTLRDASIWQLAYSLVLRYDGDLSDVDMSLLTLVDAVISLSDQMGEHGVAPEQISDFEREFRITVESIPAQDHHGIRADVRKVLDRQKRRIQLLPLAAELTRRRHSSGEYSFGDQMTLAARVARNCPEVGECERARYASVLLDEYQDTSQSQLSLMRDLFNHHPVMAVGDPLQAIYGWRGASAGTIENFATTFRRPSGEPAHQFVLSTSWRNDQKILDVANIFARSLQTQGLATTELQPSPKAGQGRVCLGLYETELSAAEGIADFISPYWSQSQSRIAAGGKGLSIAVLVRKKKEIESIERALINRGIAAEVIGVAGLLHTPEVADLHAYLRVIFDPTAGDALMRLLTGPRWRIGAADIAALHRSSRPVQRDDLDEIERSTLIESLDRIQEMSPKPFSPEGRNRLVQFAEELRRMRARSGLSLSDLITDIERTIGLDIEVGALPAERSLRARRHIDRFISEAGAFAAAGGGPIAFLSWLDVAVVQERGLAVGEVEVNEDAVQLLTIHTAKGLEWDVVVVPGMTEHNFPAADRGDDNWLTQFGILPFPLRGDALSLPDIELSGAPDQKSVDDWCKQFGEEVRAHGEREEERLAYVAVTRPRHALLITATWWQEGKRLRGPSRFFTSIPDECVEWIHQEPAPADEARNPLHDLVISSPWPIDPLGERRAAFDVAVNRARASTVATPLTEVGDEWLNDARLLLAERPNSDAIFMPARLSVSALVGLRADPSELARRLRRPMPFKPDPLARRGTAFHKWLEGRFGAQTLFDIDDDRDDVDSESDLELLKSAWLASEWAERIPFEVEVPFETTIDAVLIRGRMDAVYRDGDQWHIVDWKTGGPKSGKDLEAAAIQLAVYRLAWAQLMDIATDHISAAFHHVSTNETVRPADLLDYQGLVALLRGDNQR